MVVGPQLDPHNAIATTLYLSYIKTVELLAGEIYKKPSTIITLGIQYTC